MDADVVVLAPLAVAVVVVAVPTAAAPPWLASAAPHACLRPDAVYAVAVRPHIAPLASWLLSLCHGDVLKRTKLTDALIFDKRTVQLEREEAI